MKLWAFKWKRPNFHLQAKAKNESREEGSKKARKTIKTNFPAFPLDVVNNSIEIAERRRKWNANVKLFNFFFVFLIDIKQIFSINN